MGCLSVTTEIYKIKSTILRAELTLSTEHTLTVSYRNTFNVHPWLIDMK